MASALFPLIHLALGFHRHHCMQASSLHKQAVWKQYCPCPGHTLSSLVHQASQHHHPQSVLCCCGDQQWRAWLIDGNVPYLQGKHIILFLVNLALLLILLAYTLSIVLGPWLQRKTEYRVLFWVVRLKPLFDAYFGPLKDDHRYWTGLLLLSRMIGFRSECPWR